MNKKALGYGGLVLTILGLMGTLSQTGPLWSRWTVLLSGIVIILVTVPSRYKR